MKKVVVPCQSPDDRLPRYETENASGADLSSAVETVIGPGEWKTVPTGLRLEIPPGVEAQVRPRSGLASRRGVTGLNAPGTIDADYRGEVAVLLINHGRESFPVTRGMRIAQLVIASVTQANLIQIKNLSETERGSGGFGSTGTKSVDTSS